MNGARATSFGTRGVTWVDRFGTWLSRRAILAAIKKRKDLRVLELGCGFHARNLQSIEDRAQSLTGVDFNVAPELAERPKFEVVASTIDEALRQLAGRKFDLIMIISVLEHLEEPLRVLRECHSMCAPQGVLMINVPTWSGKVFLEFAAFKLGVSPAEEMDDHKMYYSKRDLWPLMVKAGYRPSQIRLRYHKFGLNLFAVGTRAEDA